MHGTHAGKINQLTFQGKRSADLSRPGGVSPQEQR
jgi:hypothetical protein